MVWLLLFVCFSVFMAKKSFAAKDKKAKAKANVGSQKKIEVVKAEENTFDEEYLASVVGKSISQLVDFGLNEVEAGYLLDNLESCHFEEDYLRLIEKCQEKRKLLKDERVKALSIKLDAKAEKGVNSDAIAMVRDFLENANTKEQLDRIEQHIAKMRGSSNKPKAKVVPKPAPKKSTKTA